MRTSTGNRLGIDGAKPTGGEEGARYLRSFPRYPSRGFISIIMFLGFVFARYVQLGERRGFFAAIRLEFLLGIVVIALVVFELSNRMPRVGRSGPLLVLISLLFFVLLLQLPVSMNARWAEELFMDRVIKFALMTFFIVVLVDNPKNLKLFLAMFLFSIFYITLESVQGLMDGSLVWENQGIPRLHGSVPIYEHPNSLGGVAMGTLPFIWFLFRKIKSRILRLALLALSVTSLVCVVYSGSRTAYLGLVALILWAGFQSPKKKKFLGMAVIVGSLSMLIIPGDYIKRFSSITAKSEEGQKTSKDMRIEILQDGLIILKENPLGVGIGSFPTARKAKFGRSQDTHNLYLEVATNLGIHGFLVFVAMIFTMLAALRRVYLGMVRIRKRVNVLRRRDLSVDFLKALNRLDMDVGFLGSTAQATAGFIIVRLVLGFFGMDFYEVYWWFGAGLAIALSGILEHVFRNIFILEELANNQ